MELPRVNLTTAGAVPVEEDDYCLVKAIALHNQNAFSEVYQRYHRQVYNYLLRIIQDEAGAEDILQEVFLAIWQGAGKFKQKSSVKTWIFRIAYNQSISWLRRHHRRSRPIDEDSFVDDDADPEETAMSAIRNTQLKRAITLLAPKHRVVLELAFVQDMSYSEISEILDCPVGTVKSRMSYALRNLNQVLMKIGIDLQEDTGKESRR